MMIFTEGSAQGNPGPTWPGVVIKILLTIVHQLNLPQLSLLVAQAIISEIEAIRLGADTDYAKTIYLYRLSVCN